jgi:hypothetical protein
MRLSRLTTRRMMIVVAVLALALSAERQVTKRGRIVSIRRHMAFVHATSEQWFRWAARVTAKSPPWTGTYELARPADPEAERRRRVAWQLEMAEYHGELSRQYQGARWRPWVGLPPHPPRPE